MKVCERCGVEFDPSDFIPGAPCADCQFEDPLYEWVKFADVKDNEEARMRRHIERLWKRRMSDGEISNALGVAREVVWRRRKIMGLTAHVFTGDEKWKDPEAVRRAIGDRMRGNNYKQGWGPGQKHGKAVTDADV